MAFLIGSSMPGLQRLAVPFVSLLIAFLAFSSQWLFATSPDLDPGPLTTSQTYTINTLLVCIAITYYRTCATDPGRYVFPKSFYVSNRKKTDGDDDVKQGEGGGEEEEEEEDSSDADDAASAVAAAAAAAETTATTSKNNHKASTNNTNPTSSSFIPLDGRKRHCKKCLLPKPPRAHHCKTCSRCVPKMDHHCPWTGNCVSLQTFPHFLRFLFWTNAGLTYLLYLVFLRFKLGLYDKRHLPAYLGPTAGEMGLLVSIAVLAGITEAVLGMLMITSVKGWVMNTTMIEGWEVERHEAVLERRGDRGDDGGWWRGGGGGGGAARNGGNVYVEPVEFPYDVGFFANMAQAMGTGNVLLWFWPLAGAPRIAPFPSSASSSSSDRNKGKGRGRGGRQEKEEEEDTTGWAYEENGMNDREGMWPPLDPDKVRHAKVWRERKGEMEAELRSVYEGNARYLSPREEMEAFRRRQEMDWRKRGMLKTTTNTEEGEEEDRYGEEVEEENDLRYGGYGRGGGGGGGGDGGSMGGGRGGMIVNEGKSGWVNAEGEHLGDYGVDEDAEFDDDDELDSGEEVLDGDDGDDDEVPLAELIRRRKIRNTTAGGDGGDDDF